MSSQPQDSTTQAAASTAAQNASATQSANAATAQTNSNNQQSSLFGTYDPSTNSYSGGTESAALNPSSLTQTGLTGSYANEYNNQANQQATAAQQAVGTTMQNLNSRGMGATPAGFAADQQRQAYQTQAANNGNNYAADFGAQNTAAINAYNTANGLLSSTQQANQNSATTNNADAAGTNTSLYGTASQQTPTAIGSVLGAAGGLANAGASIYKTATTPATGCWVAAEIFGGWNEPRTNLVRDYIFGDFRNSWLGCLLSDLYLEYGERMAKGIKRHRSLRWIFTRICNLALRQARKAA